MFGAIPQNLLRVTTQKNAINYYINKPVARFIILWLFTSIIYYPAAKAGFVTDFSGWLDQVKNHSFLEYINRTNFEVVSLYQFTQLNTWILYKLIGTSTWAWHTVFVTLHALNAYFIYKVLITLLNDSGINKYDEGSFIGATLFCTTPYISEVIVWEPSFHYLQGLLLILLIIRCVQDYIHTPKTIYIISASILFLLSTHGLEVFYLTPWMVLSVLLFYRHQNIIHKLFFRRSLLLFVVPIFVIFFLRLVEFRILHGDWVSRVGSSVVLDISDTGLGKAGKHLFNIIFLARYLPYDLNIFGTEFVSIKKSIYGFFDTTAGIASIYLSGITILFWGLFSFKKITVNKKVLLLLSFWTGASLLLITPLWFYDMMTVTFDRYVYVTCCFIYAFMGIIVWGIKSKIVRGILLIIIIGPQLYFTLKTNISWGRSAHVIESMLTQIEPDSTKTTLVLNMPESLNGIPMLGAWEESELQLMHNLLYTNKQALTNTYDVLAYNMVDANNGAHVRILNDSMIHVQLNQTGTWWWYKSFGGYNYENAAYKLNIIDGGNYELLLKQPITNYNMWYQTGYNLKQVDNRMIGIDQY